MARPDNATIEQLLHPRDRSFGFGRVDLQKDGTIEVPSVAGGMFTRLPRDKIPLDSWRLCKNARLRDADIVRRPGTTTVGTKPDSNKIIKLVSFILEDGSIKLVRFSQSTAHSWNGSSWTAFTINDGGFTGTADRFDVTSFQGKLYITDGENRLWEMNFNSMEINQLSEAPRAKYCMTFADRVIVAGVFPFTSPPRPHQVQWPINGDPSDWTGTGSGFNDLFADDLGNEITGLMRLGDVGVVLRRKTLVHMTRQPFALSPFAFRTVVEDIGCDLPFSVVNVPGGMIFADTRTTEVYFYRVGAFPQPLGVGLNRDFFEDLASAKYAEASYDPYEKEYHLGLVWTTADETFSRTWVFNRERQRWTYDDGPDGVTAFSSIIIPPNLTSIDELVGTIDALTGTIDELGGEEVTTPLMFKGIETGEVIKFDDSSANDFDATTVELEVDSYNLGSFSKRRILKQVHVACTIPNDTSVTIENSRDEASWLNSKTVSYTGATTPQYVRLTPRQQLVGNDLYWRIKSTGLGFRIKSWWAQVLDKSLQMGTQQ